VLTLVGPVRFISMGSYLVRRLLLAVSTVVAVSFGAFVAFGIALDPTYPMILGPPAPRHMVQQYYHLTDPILSRYWRWVTGFVQHGFGTTVGTASNSSPPNVVQGRPIGPELWSAAKMTAQLVGASMVLVVFFSVLLGVVSARRPGSKTDIGTRAATYVMWSIPAFLIGDLIRRAIVGQQTYRVGFTGPGGTFQRIVGNTNGDWFLLGPPTGGVVDWFRHMTLPCIALAIGLIGVYSRYIRSSMIESLQQQYAVVARAKGVPERGVLLHHALRNSLIPFTSVLSLEFGAIIGASIAVDAVFSLGGFASAFLAALGAADPFELTSLVICVAVVVTVFMTLSDLLTGWLDPRIRIGANA
jgi:peptide/nickel transport system permease protein